MTSNIGFASIMNGGDQPPPSYQESFNSPKVSESAPFTPLPMQSQQAISREQMYREIIQKYEINRTFADKLQMLQGFKIVFVFDDSGSMKNTLDDSPLNKSSSVMKATRWDELQYFANISIEIAALFDPAGCDVYFLNKGLVRNVKHTNQLQNYFSQGPSGYTPLTNTFNAILGSNIEAIKEKKLLIVLVTDGEPTDSCGNVDIKNFKKCLMNRHPIDRIFVTIVACTDEDHSIEYLNKWDRMIKHLDVVDDYRNERLEIKRSKGSNYSFSYGDYVVKSMIGSIDPSIDKQDERRSDKCILI